jgi:4-carboxymuconolactone decarboxylase
MTTQHEAWSLAAAVGRQAMNEAVPGIPDLIDASLNSLSPNTARRIYEQIWGDVYQDATITLRDRTIAAIAALTALGGAETNLTLQAHIALNAGLEPGELVAVVEQVATVAGFPRTQAALNVLRDVFDQRGVGTPS